MAKQRVGVKVQFAIQSHDAAVTGENEGIDFGERGVGFPEGFVQTLQHGARLRNGGFGHTDLAGGVICFGVFEASGGVDEDFVNFFGGVRGNFFNVHAAFAGGHEHHALGGAIDHHADIQLFFNVRALFDEQAPHLLTLGAGLVGFQLHAQDVGGIRFDFVERFGDLYAATFATAAGVDLRFDHPHFAAELTGSFDGLSH